RPRVGGAGVRDRARDGGRRAARGAVRLGLDRLRADDRRLRRRVGPGVARGPEAARAQRGARADPRHDRDGRHHCGHRALSLVPADPRAAPRVRGGRRRDHDRGPEHPAAPDARRGPEPRGGRVGGDDRHRTLDRVRPGRSGRRGARPEGHVRDRGSVRPTRRGGAGARAARLEARERGCGGGRRGGERAGSQRGGRARRRSGRRLDGGRGAVDTQPVTAPRSAVRRLATARLISITGGAAAYAALNFTIFEKTGSASWVAVSLLLTFGVQGFVGPPAGMLGDRFDRRKVMIVSELAGAACFGMMALSDEPAWLLTWAFLSALAEAPFFSASEAAIPNVAGPELTTWANSLVSASRLSGIAVGPALGGALLAVSNNPDLVFGVNAVSFVL